MLYAGLKLEPQRDAEHMPAYVSEVLYHLVGSRDPNNHEGNFDILRSILRSQEVRPCKVGEHSGPMTLRVDYNADLRAGEPAEQTVTCYCDIPRDQLNPIHTSKYGMFGVGVDRHTVAAWGGRPVIYIPTTKREPTCYWNSFHREVMTICRGLEDHFPSPSGTTVTTRNVGDPPKTPEQSIDFAKSLLQKHLLAFMKFFDVTLQDNDPANFYMEREWRKFGRLGLELALREVVVASGYKDRLAAEFPNLPVPIVEFSNATA